MGLHKPIINVSSGSGGSITVDSSMSASSANPVQNKVVKSYVDNAVKADSAMSDTSEKPVQNKVIKEYIDSTFENGRGDSITIDSVMSGTSTNPVQNSVIKAYIDNAIANVNNSTVSGTYKGNSNGTTSGSTRTVNIDDSTSKCLLILGAGNFTFVFSSGAFISRGTYLVSNQNVFIGRWTQYSKFENGVLSINLGDDDWQYLNYNNKTYSYYCL